MEKANQLDKIALKDIGEFDEQKLFTDVNSNRCQACGSGPILAAMITSKKLGAEHSKIISYGTSGDYSKDYNSVVGYLSSVFYSIRASECTLSVWEADFRSFLGISDNCPATSHN